MAVETLNIKIERIFLDLENPRFPSGTVENQSDVIKSLCKDELILGLARDILKNGINPLELFGLIKDQKPSKNLDDQTYIVAEGNRRMCALKLLYDPDLAPTELKSTYENLSKGWEKIDEVPCAVFDNREDCKIWLERLHGDLNDGIARKKWNSEQKQRFSGDSRNARAQALLDYAQTTLKILNDKQRKDKLTTAQRYLSNPVFREAIGIDDASKSEILINRPNEDFDARLKVFIANLIDGTEVHSRSDRADIIDYARALENGVPVNGGRVTPKPISTIELKTNNGTVSQKKSHPRNPPKLRNIVFNKKIADLLKEIANMKLANLYYGICKIELEDFYVPILTISSWAFVESLTAAAGRHDNTAFKSFYSKEKISKLGLSKDFKTYQEILVRLEETGNTTKHHFVSAHFNGQQLANDMVCLEPLIIATLEDILKNKNTSN